MLNLKIILRFSKWKREKVMINIKIGSVWAPERNFNNIERDIICRHQFDLYSSLSYIAY